MPDVLTRLAHRPDTIASLLDLQDLRGRRVVFTGAGLAEGPARYGAHVLSRFVGLNARFEPISALIDRREAVDQVLVVLSQSISPNAMIALQSLDRFERGLLITGVSERGECEALCSWREEGGLVWRIGQVEEGEMLLRVQGPAASCFEIAAWGAKLAGQAGLESWSGQLACVPDAMRRAWTRAPRIDGDQLLEDDVALVSIGEHDEMFHGLRWKMLEGLWQRVPPVLDILQLAHGPLQGLWERRVLFLAMTHAGCAAHDELIARAERVLGPAHRMERCVATLPRPLHLFEYDAWLNAMVCHALSDSGRDLSSWPGKGHDQPLYDLSRSDDV